MKTATKNRKIGNLFENNGQTVIKKPRKERPEAGKALQAKKWPKRRQHHQQNSLQKDKNHRHRGAGAAA